MESHKIHVPNHQPVDHYEVGRFDIFDLMLYRALLPHQTQAGVPNGQGFDLRKILKVDRFLATPNGKRLQFAKWKMVIYNYSGFTQLEN